MSSLDKPLTLIDMLFPIHFLPMEQWVMEAMMRLAIPPDAVIVNDVPA